MSGEDRANAGIFHWAAASVIAVPVAVASIILAAVSNGYALSILWKWSAVRYGAPEVDWLAFALVYMGVRSLLVTAYCRPKTDAPVWRQIVEPHVRAAGIVCFAWLLMYVAGAA